MDVDALIDNSNQELKDYANQRIPLPKKNLDEKDKDLLSKVNLIAQAVKVDEVPIFGVDVSDVDRLIRSFNFVDKRRVCH